jgi:hypothetical protein
MTIYEILERMIIGPVFRSDEEQAAVEVIHQLRATNAFGTTAAALDVASHECAAGELWPDAARCLTCGAEMEVRPHDCSPVTHYSWGASYGIRSSAHVTKCRFCGREM